MAWPRYILYFFGIASAIWMLTQVEIAFPGSLQLQEFADTGDTAGHGASSPLYIVQPLLLMICVALLAWVANYCPSQRPIAVPFGGVALAFLLRELDELKMRYLADNLSQVLIAIVGALMITYVYRHRRRMKICWARVWPSPGIALIFAGALIEFAFAPLAGREPLWQSVLGADTATTVATAVRQFIELLGYLLWLIGTIEYVYQARAIAYREPQPAATRRRQKRRHDRAGRF